MQRGTSAIPQIIAPPTRRLRIVAAMDRLTHAAIVVFSAVASLAPIVLAQTSSSSATSTSTSTSTTSSSSSVTACPTVLSPSYSAPVVGSGWTAQLVARNLTSPRSILFDSEGALLVVQQGVGILRVQFDDFGGTCLVVHSTTTVVENTDVGDAPSRTYAPVRSGGVAGNRLTKRGEDLFSSTMLFNCLRMAARCMRLLQMRRTDGLISQRMDLLANGRRS